MPAEFEAGYPMARAFRPAELDWARPLSGGNTSGAAALLWSLKEAAVKALGVGFHFHRPPGGGGPQPQPLAGGGPGLGEGRADYTGLGPARSRRLAGPGPVLKIGGTGFQPVQLSGAFHNHDHFLTELPDHEKAGVVERPSRPPPLAAWARPTG